MTNKIKGTKFYGVINGEGGSIINVNYDIERSKKDLDKNWPFLVELTVTKVYTRETDLKEIEVDDHTVRGGSGNLIVGAGINY